jgi:hypothetical protein
MTSGPVVAVIPGMRPRLRRDAAEQAAGCGEMSAEDAKVCGGGVAGCVGGRGLEMSTAAGLGEAHWWGGAARCRWRGEF